MLNYSVAELRNMKISRLDKPISYWSDNKSLHCPEFGIYVRVVGKLQIEQSELW